MASRFTKDALSQRLTWSAIDLDYLQSIIAQAKLEDMAGLGLKNPLSHPLDVTSEIIPKTGNGKAALIARKSFTLCGLHLVPLILTQYNPSLSFETNYQDGDTVNKNTSFGILNGPAKSLLQAERILLNFLQYLSGIATTTKSYSDCLNHSETRLLDTRKTTPLYRILEKYAFVCGGGYNHRYGLYDRIMIKDNHIAVLETNTDQSLAEQMDQLRARFTKLPIQIEVDSLDQLNKVLDAQPDCILLDNFSIEATKEAIRIIDDQAYTEASGGITLNNLANLKNLGLDFISTGAPIHQSQWVDIGLDWL
jgi:nicotinate-nucleotide pyrophosphorylase (carboxylating)